MPEQPNVNPQDEGFRARSEDGPDVEGHRFSARDADAPAEEDEGFRPRSGDAADLEGDRFSARDGAAPAEEDEVVRSSSEE